MLEDELDDFGDLGVDRRLLARARTLSDHHVAQAVVPRHARERGECAAVDAGVGEGHEPLVPAAVVPGEGGGGEQRAERVEHRFKACTKGNEVVIILGRVGIGTADLAEEVRRR